METWLDGYNVILRQGWNKKASLEEARARLLTAVAALKQPVRVYFDAQKFPGRVTRSEASSPDVRAIFVREGSADDAIVEDLRGASGVTVITDDRELRNRARQLKANAVGVDKFIKRLQHAVAPLSKPTRKPRGTRSEKEQDRSRSLSGKDVEDWLDFMGLDEDWQPDIDDLMPPRK